MPQGKGTYGTQKGRPSKKKKGKKTMKLTPKQKTLPETLKKAILKKKKKGE